MTNQTQNILDLNATLWGFDDPDLREYCYTQADGQYCLAQKGDWEIIECYSSFADLIALAYLCALADTQNP
jgi:hypothetical protein